MNIVWFSLLAIAFLAPLSTGHISLCFYCPYHSVIPASTFLADFITNNRCLLEYWRSSEPIEGLKGLDPWHNKAELSKRLSNFSIGEADTPGNIKACQLINFKEADPKEHRVTDLCYGVNLPQTRLTDMPLSHCVCKTDSHCQRTIIDSNAHKTDKHAQTSFLSFSLFTITLMISLVI